MLFQCKPQAVISVLGIIREPTEETGTAAEVLITDCAWCLAEAGLPPGDGSHGICPAHTEQIIMQAREYRRKRDAA